MDKITKIDSRGTMWVVSLTIKGKSYAKLSTLKFTRKESIAEFISGSSMTWEHCKKLGWQCLHVNPIFEVITKSKHNG